MDAEEIGAAAAAAELNILGGLASVTGLQSPAPTRPAGATAAACVLATAAVACED